MFEISIYGFKIFITKKRFKQINMFNVNFIIAQLLGLTATFILCYSYLSKTKKEFLFLSLIGDMVYGLSFIFVNSLGTGLITLLSCLQSVCFLFYEKKKTTMPKVFAFMFIVSFVIVGILNMETMLDIIPIITYIWFTITLYMENIKMLKIMFIIPNLVLAVYDVMVMAYANAFEDCFEALFLASAIIIDYVKYKKNNYGKEKRATLNKQNSILNKLMGVKFNLQSDLFNVGTSDDQLTHKQATKGIWWINHLILQNEHPKLPQH